MNIIKPIFEFKCLFDLDYALVNFVQNTFKGNKYFNSIVMNEDPINTRLILQYRTNPNPLSILIDNKYISSIDSLYDEILERFQDLIYDNIYLTEVFTFFSNICMIEEDNVVKPAVLYENDIQKEVLDLMPLSITTYDTYEIPLDKYDALYMYNIANLDKFKPVPEAKSITIMYYGFNTKEINNELVVHPTYGLVYGKANQMYIMDPYSKILKPEGVINNEL